MYYFNLIMLPIAFFTLYSSFLFFLILIDNKDDFKKNKVSTDKNITILIPAHNEENNIKRSIDSCLEQDYPKDKLKIIVINDGSTDSTKEICEEYQSKGLIKLISKKQSGKVPSCNFALKNYVDTELFCVLDADTYFEKDALRRIVPHFDNKKVGAVLSSIKVENAKGIIEKIQDVEYYTAVFLRKINSYYNGNVTTHGATVFRTSAVKEVGYFDENNLVEDMEICLNLIDHNYKVESNAKAFSYTVSPKTFKSLFKQRVFRWYTGFFENILKYKHLIFNSKHPGLGFVTIPFSLMWVGIVSVLALTQGVSIAKGTFYNFKTLSEINFDFLFYIRNSFSGIRLGLVDIITIMTFATLFITLFITYKLVKAKKTRFVKSTIVYIILFTLTQSIFWIASIFNFMINLLFRREKTPWKSQS